MCLQLVAKLLGLVDLGACSLPRRILLRLELRETLLKIGHTPKRKNVQTENSNLGRRQQAVQLASQRLGESLEVALHGCDVALHALSSHT